MDPHAHGREERRNGRWAREEMPDSFPIEWNAEHTLTVSFMRENETPRLRRCCRRGDEQTDLARYLVRAGTGTGGGVGLEQRGSNHDGPVMKPFGTHAAISS